MVDDPFDVLVGDDVNTLLLLLDDFVKREKLVLGRIVDMSILANSEVGMDITADDTPTLWDGIKEHYVELYKEHPEYDTDDYIPLGGLRRGIGGFGTRDRCIRPYKNRKEQLSTYEDVYEIPIGHLHTHPHTGYEPDEYEDAQGTRLDLNLHDMRTAIYAFDRIECVAGRYQKHNTALVENEDARVSSFKEHPEGSNIMRCYIIGDDIVDSSEWHDLVKIATEGGSKCNIIADIFNEKATIVEYELPSSCKCEGPINTLLWEW